MGPKTCPHCGYPLGNGADHCPVCGTPIRKKTRAAVLGRLIAVAAVLFFLGRGIYLFLENEREETRREQARIAAREERGRHAAFIENIEKHYRALADLYDRKRITQARAKIYLFKKYGKLDYRDVRTIQTNVLIASLEARAKKIPESDAKGRLEIYRRLMELDPKNRFYKERHSFYARSPRP